MTVCRTIASGATVLLLAVATGSCGSSSGDRMQGFSFRGRWSGTFELVNDGGIGTLDLKFDDVSYTASGVGTYGSKENLRKVAASAEFFVDRELSIQILWTPTDSSVPDPRVTFEFNGSLGGSQDRLVGSFALRLMPQEQTPLTLTRAE